MALFYYCRGSYRLQVNFINFTVETSEYSNALEINHMSRVARKRFFGVHATDSPARQLELRFFGDFSISAGRFSISVAKRVESLRV